MAVDVKAPELQAAITFINTFLEEERKARKIPGLSFAIIYDQEILWSNGLGFADLEHRVPATPQTLYRIASITKLFTATMLMQLRDAGKLHLDNPLEHYLPTIRIRSRFSDPSPITFRQVVAHVSGLPRDTTMDLRYEENTVIFPSAEEIQASLKGIELISAPMMQKRYSNLGFALLGLVLEHIAGQPYTQYVVDHILRPLEMERSGFEPVEAWPADLQTLVATPYYAQQADEAVPHKAPMTIERGLNPAGGLYSSIEDMTRFLSLQFCDGSAEGRQILKGSTLREMHTPAFLDSSWQEATAIGWGVQRIQDYTTIGHSGGIYGFSTNIVLVPALKLGLALFLNTAADAREMNHAVLEYLLPTFNRLLQRQQMTQKATSLPPAQPEWVRYEGRYTEPGLRQSFEVALKPDKLIATIYGIEVTLLSQGEHRFRMQNGPFEGEIIRFDLNENLIVTRANVSGLLFVRE